MINTQQSPSSLPPPQAHNKVFIALLVTVFILPWPHGGEIVWQYLLFCISIFGLATIYFINTAKQNNINRPFSALTNIKTPLVILGVWLLYQVIQVIPLPINLSNIAEQNLNSTNWQTISIAPNITLIEILKHTSYITVFVLALLLLNTKQRILILANTLFIGSAIIALYSLVNHYTHGAFDLVSSIPPWTISWERAAHGTFSYQNHYASFLTLTIPLGFGLIYANLKNNNKQVGSNNWGKLIDLVSSINGLYLLCLFIMFTALFKTASRGGNSIFVISMAITFVCVLLQQNKSKKEKTKHLLLLVLSLLTIGTALIASGITDSLTKRLESQGYNPNGRDLMHKTALAIIQERPLVGAGAGTYPALQHKFKSPLLGNSAMSKRAHNDYLELLSNQGVIGFSLLAMPTLWLYWLLFKGLRKTRSRRSANVNGLQIASFCSVTAILLHSLADFNFHLPVNAVYFYLVLAIGIQAQQLKSKNKNTR